jgi:hypothetical protein
MRVYDARGVSHDLVATGIFLEAGRRMDALPQRHDDKSFESLHAVWFHADQAATLLKRRIEMEAPMANSAHRDISAAILELKHVHERLVFYFSEPEPCRVCTAEDGP